MLVTLTACHRVWQSLPKRCSGKVLKVPIIKLATKDAFPEGLRELVEEKDGGFVVDVVPKAKLEEFRQNNTTLKVENDGLKNKVTVYEGIVGGDPEKAKAELSELRSIKQQVSDGKLKGSTEITAELERRTAEMKQGYEAQLREQGEKLAAATKEKTDLKNDFDRTKIDQLITSAVLAEDSGVNPAALTDVLTRARSVYKVNAEGKVVAMQGDTIVYGSDGVTPLPPKEWLGKVLTEASYLAKPSAGGGASGDVSGKAGLVNSPEFLKLPPAERIKRFRKQASG
jgi:hypothetical protein